MKAAMNQNLKRLLSLKWGRIITYLLLLTLILVCNIASANPLSELTAFKESLEEEGISIEMTYIGEFLANTAGGSKRDSTYLDNFDLTMSLDTKQLGLWDNGTFFVHFLNNGGDEKITGDIVDNLQVISNIEAPRASRLYQLWYEHSFNEETFFALLGFHDFNSDFDVSEYSGLYLNDAHGTQRDITAAGRPSVFPITGPAVRFKLTPDENWEYLLGVYDGDPDDPEDVENFPRSDLDSAGGAFIATEVAYHLNEDGGGLPGFFKLGFWYNTGEFDDLVDLDAAGNAIKRDGNFGGYFIIDKMIYREEEDQGLGAFVRFGQTPKYINEVDRYVAAGLNYTGLIPNRDEDEFGISGSYAHISDDLTKAGGRDNHETVLEATYKAVLCDHFAVQPDLQIIFNPAANQTYNTAVVAGIRFELNI